MASEAYELEVNVMRQCRNLMNSIAHEPLNGIQPKFTQILAPTAFEETKWLGCQGHVVKGRSHSATTMDISVSPRFQVHIVYTAQNADAV